MKTCSMCGVEKPLEDFNKSKARGYQARCRGCQKEYMAEYRRKNKARLALSNKRWSQENAEYRSEKRRERYARDKDQENERSRIWREANGERAAEYRRENASRYSQHASNRRARLKDALVPGFAEPVTEVLTRFYGRACLVPGCEQSKATLDHVVALENGGKHTYWNAQPLCLSHNASKNAHHSTDYREGHNPYGILMDRTITN